MVMQDVEVKAAARRDLHVKRQPSAAPKPPLLLLRRRRRRRREQARSIGRLSVIFQVTRRCNFDCDLCSETNHLPDWL